MSTDLLDSVDFFLGLGDLGPSLERTLGDDDGSQFSLTGVLGVTFSMKHRDTGVFVVTAQPAAVVDGPGRVVRYDWQQGDTSIAGMYYGTFRVTFADGRPITFPNDMPLTIRIAPLGGA